MLHDRGILYAPDYVVNAGGLIQVADEIGGFSESRARARTARIFETTRRILALADSEGIPPGQAADRHAGQRMRDIGRAARCLAARERPAPVRPGSATCWLGEVERAGRGTQGGDGGLPPTGRRATAVTVSTPAAA